MAKAGKKSKSGSGKGSKPGNKAGRTYPEQGSEKSVKKDKVAKAC